MPTNVLYKNPILRKYADLILASTTRIKTVYYGENMAGIQASRLPAIILNVASGSMGHFDTVRDRHDLRILITVVTDIRNTTSDEQTTAPGMCELDDLIEGRNDDLTLKTDSLMYILRHNIDIDPTHNLRTDIASVTRLTMGTVPNKRLTNGWSIEGTIELTATFFQNR